MIWPFRGIPKEPSKSGYFIDKAGRSRFFAENERLDGENFTGKEFGNFTSVGCTFKNCDFSNTNFLNACFGAGESNSYYIKCKFDRSSINSVSPGCATFEECSFLDIEIVSFYALNIEMINCVFSGVLKSGFFNGTVKPEYQQCLSRDTNRFEGNDFSMAKLMDIAFRTGIDLDKQILPEDWAKAHNQQINQGQG